MQAIITKYYGPSNTKGSRIKAKCSSGSITVGYPYHLSGDAVHRFAAVALCDKMGWNSSNLVGGTLPNGQHCFVFVPV